MAVIDQSDYGAYAQIDEQVTVCLDQLQVLHQMLAGVQQPTENTDQAIAALTQTQQNLHAAQAQAQEPEQELPGTDPGAPAYGDPGTPAYGDPGAPQYGDPADPSNPHDDPGAAAAAADPRY